MHIPDGFLSTPVWVTLDAVSLPAVGLAARRAQRELDETRIPLLGVMGAFVFAAQMINFPVGPGTSGHLLGSTLLACTMGPAAAAVVMTAILAVQALIFQDGGLLALGANVFNMALLGVLAGYLPYRVWGRRFRDAAVFLGGVLSVLSGAMLAITQLLASGLSVPRQVLGVSLGLFLVTAIIEGAITVVVIRSIERINPAWLEKRGEPAWLAVGGLGLVALLLAVLGVLVASGSPDGLEKLAGELGIANRARALFETPLADYELGLLEGPWLRKASAGVMGLAAIGGACLLVGRLLAGRRRA